MSLVAQVLAVLAAAQQVIRFVMHAVAWRGGARRAFEVISPAHSELVARMAVNQAFANLFPAVGVLIGVAMYATSDGTTLQMLPPIFDHDRLYGRAVVFLGLACMIASALVLLVGSRGREVRAALIQALLPAAALIALAASAPPPY